MPVIASSSYKAPALFRLRHVQTVYPTLFRKVPRVAYQRERLELEDGDFLDLDWSCPNAPCGHLAVVCHGLESNADSHYMRGMVHALNEVGIGTVCINFRGCSGEPNRLLRSYHSGASDDVRSVLDHVRQRKREVGKSCSISLIGFSLGGNVVLKCLGEGEGLEQVVSAVVFSVPCDLEASAKRLASGLNQIYMRRFIKSMVAKLRMKNELLGAGFEIAHFEKMRTFAEFDGAYTAPAHGYQSAEDYWQACSSRYFLDSIRIPTLLVNAADDPFLGPECFPREAISSHPHVYLEVPRFGGHVGFISTNSKKRYWHETRTVEFLAMF